MIINNSGGGAPLNFKVLGGTAQPANPKENTIWVNTSTSITSWVFSASPPENPTQGMVWFQTGISSAVAFSVLKSKQIRVYPSGCKQYVSGAWLSKTAKSYQSGVWKEWLLWFYNKGDQCTALTGGWKVVNGNSGNGEIRNTEIYLGYSGSSGRDSAAYTVNKVDITHLKTLYAEVQISYVDEDFRFGVHSKNTESYPTLVAGVKSYETGLQTLSVDVSTLTGEYYIAACANINRTSIYKVYAE